jgi:hypothetical protein
MESSARSPEMAAPFGWRSLLIRAVQIAIVGFVVLQAKELVDAGTLDTQATAVDAVLIAAGVLVVDAILKWAKA